MKRSPSIYVDLDTFISIMKEYEVTPEDCNTIAKKCKEQSKLKMRRLVSINQADKKKLEKVVEADTSTVKLFHTILVQERLNRNHRGITPITQGSFEYPMLSQVTQLVETFCTDFNYTYEEGFRFYIGKALDIMGKKYGLNKFKTYFNKIVGMAEDVEDFNNDNNVEATNKFIDLWTKIMHRVGARNYNNLPVEKLVCLMRGRMEADKAGAPYLDWLKAQFEGLDFTGNVPEFIQFYGQGAIDRYYSYSNKGLNTKEDVKKEPEFTGNTAVEREYFKMIAEKKRSR